MSAKVRWENNQGSGKPFYALEPLINHADNALYVAKRNGKDQIYADMRH